MQINRTVFFTQYKRVFVRQVFIPLCVLMQCVLHRQNLSFACRLRSSIEERLHDRLRHTVRIVSKQPVLGTKELFTKLHRLQPMQSRSSVVLIIINFFYCPNN